MTPKNPPEVEITDQQEHREEECPNCGIKIGQEKPSSKRIRVIIDIKIPSETENTEYIIYGKWCSNCKKLIEPVITDAYSCEKSRFQNTGKSLRSSSLSCIYINKKNIRNLIDNMGNANTLYYK
jgi:DNA-directed RNA polymerase subunit RPC12/RpoP